jgi:hypothetical protein
VAHVVLVIRLVKRKELGRRALAVYDDCIMITPQLILVLRIPATMPHNLVAEFVLPKHPIADNANVMGDTGLHVNDDVGILLQNAMTFYNSLFHKLWKVRKLILEVVEITTRVIGWIHVDHVNALRCK